MKHLIITIELAIDESKESLTEYQAREAAKQAFMAVRKSLPMFTEYNPNDFSYKIEA